MSARSGFDVRLLLIHLAANLNLILGGLAIAFGLYVLVAGADAVAAVLQASDATTQAVGSVAPAADAKKVGNVLDLASKGIAGIFLAMASIVAGCMLAQGLPLVLVGFGILGRQGWARWLGVLLGILGLLEGLACVGSPKAPSGVLGTGVGFLVYGVVSLVGLLGQRAADYFARRDLQPVEAGAPAPQTGRWGLAGVLTSAVVVALVCVLAVNQLPTSRTNTPAPAVAPLADKLHGVWEVGGPEAHRLAFGKDGVLYYAADKGSSKGTYQVFADQTVAMQYELPEVIYAAQKAAFDLAKKEAGNLAKKEAEYPDNPFGGIMSAIEPIREVKYRVRFNLEQGNSALTLHHAKSPTQYARSRTALTEIEQLLRDGVALADPKQPRPHGKIKEEPRPLETNEETRARYQRLQAELLDAIGKGQAARLEVRTGFVILTT